jgi:hypothetical protein
MCRYLRFCTDLRDSALPSAPGVFHAAESLTLHSGATDRLKEVLDWFNLHLPVPRLRNAERLAIFWFRAEHAEIIRRIWEIVKILRDHDIGVAMLRTNNPGRLCYQDQFQIAAIPWKRSDWRIARWV